MDNIVLYSAFHKPYIAPDVSWVRPVHVGKAISKKIIGYEGDNSGDNISDLNPYFCELTLAYWVWKNADRTQIKYWGLMHYRRYLINPSLWSKCRGINEVSIAADSNILNGYINEKLKRRIERDLKKYDIIIANEIPFIKKKSKITVEEQYKQLHIPAYWDIMVDVICEKYPDYKKSLSVFEKNGMSNCNLMIASWRIWDDYLSWMFDILFEVKRRVEMPEDEYQKRFPGFMSERLLNLYVFHNALRARHYVTLNIG